jgi:hypothetical protein
MKVLFSVIAVFVLSLAVIAQSGSSGSQSPQSQPSSGSQGQPQTTDQSKPPDQSSQSNTGSATGQQKMTGTVSKDGKSFTSDSDSKKYKVDNPDALQGHEGQQVALVVSVDPTTNTVHIIQVGGPQ